MSLVTELPLPEIDYNTPDFGPATYHQRLAAARAADPGWLAHSPLAYIVLDAEAGDFFLRSRQARFPGREIAEIFGITSGPLAEHIGKNILNATGEQHRRLRNLVAPAFTPRNADRWRPAMRGFLAELWDGLGPDTDRADTDRADTDRADTDRADTDRATRTEFVAAFARLYPSRALATVLGVPLADAPKLHRWSNLVQRQFDIQALATMLPEIEGAVEESTDYVAALLAARREDPRDDLISQLLAAEDEGDRLTPDELTELVLNVIAGGIDTTQSQLAHALRIFAGHPDQWRLLAADPDAYAPRAVTEVLRFEPVAPFTARIVLTDLDHRGVTFPAGTIVAVCAERANRDQPDGEGFDITADRDGRLFTFSAGAHYCLGANFARAELEEALKFLAPRMPGLALDGEPLLGGVEGIYNVESLPIRWD
jgi:cytochrome P450